MFARRGRSSGERKTMIKGRNPLSGGGGSLKGPRDETPVEIHQKSYNPNYEDEKTTGWTLDK